jgi:hypothetical protein
MIGRVLALQTVLLIGTTPIGGPALGAISDALGGRVPIVIGGVVALVASAFGFVAARRTAPAEPMPSSAGAAPPAEAAALSAGPGGTRR